MENLKKLSLINLIFEVFKILNSQSRFQALLVLTTTLISGLLEVLGLAIILPVIYLINDPSKIKQNNILRELQLLSNIQQADKFILFLLILIFLVFILKNSLTLLFLNYQNNFTRKLSIQITQSEFNKYFKKDFEFFSSTNSNNIIRDIVRIPNDFASNILTPLLLLFTEFFIVFFIVVGILIIDYKIVVLLSIILIPMLYLLNSFTKRKITFWGNIKNEIQPITFKQVFETIYAYIDVKLFHKESFFINRSEKLLRDFYTLTQKIKLLQSIPFKIIEVVSILGIIVLYIYVVFVLKDQKGMIQFLFLFATASYRIMPSINRILNAQMTINSSLYVFNTLSVKQNSMITQPQPIDTNCLISFNENIILDDATFKYNGASNPTLKNINININKGDVIGLIGESGSGKTTLGKLLLGFLNPQSGTFEVDKIVITKDNIQVWQKNIAYVQQDFYLLADSLIENIAFGEKIEDIDYDKVNNIIKQVKLDKIINQLPHGLNTPVGEFGKFLSGGQRQRLAIARALYKEAKFIVFDEATSALDNQTEEEIMDTLYEVTSQKLTVVIIAHRLTTLKRCNRIIRMSEGEIIEETTYNNLILS